MRIIQGDWKEFVESFVSHGVDFVVVGAHALAFHGHPRYTGDLDLFIGNDQENARRVLSALDEFGFGSLGLTIDDLVSDDQVIQLGIAPNRIDLLTFLTAVPFEEALRESAAVRLADLSVDVKVLSKHLLIRNKQALGRAKDQADVEAIDGT